jgi:hypothetical protein
LLDILQVILRTKIPSFEYDSFAENDHLIDRMDKYCCPEIWLWRIKMEIPLNAQVECMDGICGRSVDMLINPVVDQVTHLVVKEDSSPNTEYIVPIDFVTETVNNTIRLHCTKAELEKMDPFIKTTFIEEKEPKRNLVYAGGHYQGAGSYYYLPFVTSNRTVYEPRKISRSRQGSWLYGAVPALRRPMAMLAR